MSDSPIAGMLGVADFTANTRIESWREGLLRQEPNGTAPLTALTALMPSRAVDDEYYHWFTKSLPTYEADLTASACVYTNAGLSSKLTGAGVINTTYFVKMPEASTEMFRADQNVMFRSSSDSSLDCIGIVVGEPVKNGSSSYVTVRLLEADDNSVLSPATRIGNATSLLIIGSAHPDGSLFPKSIAYKETQYDNYTQIHRSTLMLTGRRKVTKTRTVDPYTEAKLDALTELTIGMENSFLFSERSADTSGQYTDNAQRRTTTRGIIRWIKAEAPSNVSYYNLLSSSTYAGKTWAQMGLHWLEDMMRLSFKYKTKGGNAKLVYAGDQAILGIQRMVRESSSTLLSVEPGAIEFGLKVMHLHSPFGTWDLQMHPLFTHYTSNAYNLLVLTPANLGYVYVRDRDVQFQPQPNKKVGADGFDGIREGFMADCGLELFFPNTFMYLGGVGLDNTVT